MGLFAVRAEAPPVEAHPGGPRQSETLRVPPVRPELPPAAPPGSAHHVCPPGLVTNSIFFCFLFVKNH